MRSTLTNRRASQAVLAVALVMLAVDSSLAGNENVEPIDLKVLYAGNPGSERTKDFERFLKKHFAEVATTDYAAFQESDADGYHVVIFDWTTIYPRDANGKIDNSVGSISMPKPPQLSREFSRPTILIGAGGGALCNRLNIAINWK